jgi:hypothetical protein
VPAGRTWPVVLQHGIPDAKPLPAQIGKPQAAGDYVAPVLAILDADSQLVLDVVEVLALDQGNLTNVSITRPVPCPRTVAIPLDTTPLDGNDLINALHGSAAFSCNIDPLDYALHC